MHKYLMYLKLVCLQKNALFIQKKFVSKILIKYKSLSLNLIILNNILHSLEKKKIQIKLYFCIN